MINILYLHAGAEMYGSDKVMFDLIRGLDKSKYKPSVLLPTEGVLANALREEGTEVSVVPYPVLRRKYFKPRGILRYGINYCRFAARIKDYAKEHHIDIIHTNTAAVLEGCYVSRKLKIPQLWVIHEIIVQPDFVYKFTSKLIAQYSDRVISVSDAVKKHLEKTGYFRPDMLRVIYNAVDTERFKPEYERNPQKQAIREEFHIPANSVVIGMVGRINRWKGQKELLLASGKLMGKYPNLYTIFVGSVYEGEEWREKELNELINTSPYSRRIINAGYRSDTECFFNLFDVFVLPSTEPDPLPTVVLEAMAVGKPVVGYRHGGICEMVVEGETGLLAEVGNTEELGEKIDILIADKEKRTQMGSRARARLLQHFSKQGFINSYSDEYDVLAKKKSCNKEKDGK